ncbi:APOBEC1 complementation factor-like [Oppia nitens]|uniref:APOBEC1 complementation factor-like n=1 Tax=Oppia nitens TaxID=1686743 RepID=UPI0023DB9400|nr:APOBEC1 complementation factor-like [Oppia nitens]
MEEMCPMDEEKNESIAKMLSLRPDYKLEQIEGQRLYRLKDLTSLPEPERGSELFIGNLPRNAYEDELVPTFDKFGTIYCMRLMMDYSGTTRGFAFVKYTNSKIAKSVAKQLDNGYLLRPNHLIAVTLSWDKTRLFIGGIPKNKKQKDVLKEMRRITDNVKDVILYMSSYSDRNRGFCFVEYETHYDAAMARRRLGSGFRLWNRWDVRVDWADPEPQVDEEIMNEVKILHVRNVNQNISENDLKNIFTFDGLHVERVKKIRDFAFIHYETRAETEAALKILNETTFLEETNSNLKTIQVNLARPIHTRGSSRRRTTSSISDHSSEDYMKMPVISGQSRLEEQLKYYQQYCTQYGSAPMQTISPYKYDNDNIKYKNDLNNNLCLFWMPFVWFNNNPNKSIANNAYNNCM